MRPIEPCAFDEVVVREIVEDLARAPAQLEAAHRTTIPAIDSQRDDDEARQVIQVVDRPGFTSCGAAARRN